MRGMWHEGETERKRERENKRINEERKADADIMLDKCVVFSFQIGNQLK